MQYPEFKVCVRCFTYNQAQYITDSMNGFCMQQTDFPFVCCIVDDASSDGEGEVIKRYLYDNFLFDNISDSTQYQTEYAEVIFAQHKINKNCYFAVLLLRENLYSKKESQKKYIYISEWRDKCEYEAICEGDDWWTDSLKLKRQVAFLDNNDKYSAIAENGIVFNEITGKKYLFSDEDDRDWSIREMIIKRRFPTAGVMLRKKCIEGFNEECRYSFDSMMWCYLGKRGKFHYSKIVSNAYRRGPGITETTKKIEWAKQVELWFLEFKRLYCPIYISQKEIYDCILRDYYNAIFNKSVFILSNDMYYCLKKIFRYSGLFAVLFCIIKKIKYFLRNEK